MRGNEKRYDQRNNESTKKTGFNLRLTPSWLLYEVLTSKTVSADRIDGVMALENTAQKITGEASLKKTATTPERFRGCNAGN